MRGKLEPPEWAIMTAGGVEYMCWRSDGEWVMGNMDRFGLIHVIGKALWAGAPGKPVENLALMMIRESRRALQPQVPIGPRAPWRLK